MCVRRRLRIRHLTVTETQPKPAEHHAQEQLRKQLNFSFEVPRIARADIHVYHVQPGRSRWMSSQQIRHDLPAL
jgi:hypothetical protein